MGASACRIGMVAALAGLACGGSSSGGGDPADGGGQEPAADGGSHDPADAGVSSPPEPVRFVVMGDTGEGNQAQHDVADAIEAKCAADGCDFVMLLGDNFYNSGVESVDDPQWQSKFEEPYADLDLPFYVVLGNHDYGGEVATVESGGVGNEFWKGPVEVAYSDVSEKWTMPDTYYSFSLENVGFMMLDTNSILWNDTENGDQREWYAGALAQLGDVDWVIAAGHHPYLSNGAHGNAGTYESIEIGGEEVPIPVPIMDGGYVKSFFDEVVCGTVDVYFAGHDHNRQWLDEPDAVCGAELIISGAGAKTTDFDNTERNTARFQDDTTPGFLYAVIDGDTFTGQFIDQTGQLDFEHTFTR